MKPHLRLILSFIGFFLFQHSVQAQNISNEGSEFWVCFPDHAPSGGNLATMSLFITSKSNSSGVVSCGSYSQNFTVQANTVNEILIPRNVSFMGAGTKVSTNKGIKVKVNEGMPKIVVYAHVFAGFRSAATLVLPYEALGRKHFAVAYDQVPNGDNLYYSQFNVVAVEDNTTINVTPVVGGVTQPKFSVNLLKAGDVYQYQNLNDVTGTLIEVDSVSSGCKRIAAFSGSTALVIGSPTCDVLTSGQISLDPLLQQLYPIDSWGKTFSLIPFYGRNTGSIFRIIAAENGTTVNVNGSIIALNAGRFYTTSPINNATLISANKPISVSQYALTQVCADSRNLNSPNPAYSDPDMVILNPLEYSIDKITLYSSSKLAISEQYLNVTIPSSKASSFKINNISFANSFQTLPGYADYSYAQIALHNLGGSNFSLAADTGFNAIAYGFGSVESYAYSAGTSLASTTIVNALKNGTNEIIKQACVNSQYDFRLILPYIPRKLTWKLDASTAEIVQENPTYTEVTINNKKLYQFKLVANKAFTTSGVKPIKITASLPVNSGVCSTVEEEVINFSFEVVDLPVAEFTSADKVCITKALQFNYVEKNVGEPVTGYLWDFGDGNTSTQKNPTHTYSNLGIYKVKLTLTSTLGCVSNYFEKSVSVIKPLTLNFETQNPLCVNNNIQFVDKSTSTDGFKSWAWDFGDGSTSALQNPAHKFAVSGTYSVKLLITSDIGCTEVITKAIKVYDPAEITFADPGSCINDMVKFSGEVVKGNVASWLWDFGDGSNDVAEKTKQVAQHKYLSTGTYNVKLTATSAEGCFTTITKTITISGSNPKVSFEVLDRNNLCSNTAVTFKNTSTIVFGNIVKLDIIYENSTGGNPVVFTDTAPSVDKIYTHKYPASAVDKNYQVTFKAYSGQQCYQEASTTITVHGSPQIEFGNIPAVCANSPKFLLTTAKETSGLAGTPKLEGKGVSGNYFDPAVAGVGTHLITYTFTSNYGCQEIKTTSITVVEIPTVDLGEDLNILWVGEKQIEPKIVGSNLKYKWSPSAGLSNDSIPNPIASPSETTKYILTVTSKEGCVVADEINVIVHIDPFIPNVFSPNNDGINDTWSIKYLETFVNASIKIFNRYGQQVFFSQQYNTPWDGKFNNVEVPVGVYYYIIEPNNGRNRYTGSVTILR